jgi:hypothetical protein
VLYLCEDVWRCAMALRAELDLGPDASPPTPPHSLRITLLSLFLACSTPLSLPTEKLTLSHSNSSLPQFPLFFTVPPTLSVAVDGFKADVSIRYLLNEVIQYVGNYLIQVGLRKSNDIFLSFPNRRHQPLRLCLYSRPCICYLGYI